MIVRLLIGDAPLVLTYDVAVLPRKGEIVQLTLPGDEASILDLHVAGVVHALGQNRVDLYCIPREDVDSGLLDLLFRASSRQ